MTKQVCVNRFCKKTSVLKYILQLKACANCICDKEVCINHFRAEKSTKNIEKTRVKLSHPLLVDTNVDVAVGDAQLK